MSIIKNIIFLAIFIVIFACGCYAASLISDRWYDRAMWFCGGISITLFFDFMNGYNVKLVRRGR